MTTGNEVFYGRIEDKFGPVIRDKLQEFGVEVLGQKIIGDNPDKITEAIREWLDQGADFVVCTGGMSVDPDDTTPSAIKQDRGGGCLLRRAGTPGSDVLAGIYEGRKADHGTSGLRDVCEEDHL